jgi:hypothetical protein
MEDVLRAEGPLQVPGPIRNEGQAEPFFYIDDKFGVEVGDAAVFAGGPGGGDEEAFLLESVVRMGIEIEWEDMTTILD